MAADDVASTAALERQSRQLQTLDTLAQRFGASLSSALSGGTTGGRELSGVLDTVASSLTSALGKSVGSTIGSTLESAAQGAVQSLSESASLMSFGGALPFAAGGIVSGGRVVPFASGGVVAAPTYFPMEGGLGLMGERGAEAVMPLSRAADGRLGVRSAGGGGDSHVTVNIAASDVDSFRRSETQVSAALARAVARGRRAL